jgi:hypothetical protein
VACFRRWDEEVNDQEAVPQLVAAFHHSNYGINFSSRRDEYLTAWFEWTGSNLSRDDIRPEVGDYGTIPIHGGRQGPSVCETTFKLPPGLAPGWHPVRVRVRNGSPSNAINVAVDVPLPDALVTITGVADGVTWTPNVLALSSGSTLCLWVEGLPENADRANVRVLLGSRQVRVTYVAGAGPEQGPRQVNVEVPSDAPTGQTRVRLALGDRQSAPVEVSIHP